MAHFMLIAEMLSADADLHLMCDPDGSFVVAEPVGFLVPLREMRADLTYVTFNKNATTTKKQTLVADYKTQLEAFIAAECNPMDDPIDIRRAFIKRFARTIDNGSGGGVNWWIIPVQTMYEPDKKVGIVYQRKILGEKDAAQCGVRLGRLDDALNLLGELERFATWAEDEIRRMS